MSRNEHDPRRSGRPPKGSPYERGREAGAQE